MTPDDIYHLYIIAYDELTEICNPCALAGTSFLQIRAIYFWFFACKLTWFSLVHHFVKLLDDSDHEELSIKKQEIIPKSIVQQYENQSCHPSRDLGLGDLQNQVENKAYSEINLLKQT